MRRYLLAVGVCLLLGGCGWFASTQSPTTLETANPPQVTATTAPSQRVTGLPTRRPPTVTPIPKTPEPSSTATSTLRPIAISLLRLPSPTPAPPQPQQPITGAPLPVTDLATTLHDALARPLETTPRSPIAPTPDGVPRSYRVPILMYHYLSEPPAGADIYRRDLSVAPDLFAAQLEQIQAAGYTTISLYDLIAALNQGTPLPARPVILTFDDGYRDSYENALPILQSQGMTATFFIVTDFIDKERPEYLTWDMVRDLYRAGMSIESHGRNHVQLRGKDKDYLVWQALGSAETIQAELGVRPHFISYPAGEYDRLTSDIFQSAHYWAALTTMQGATHSSANLFELRRIRVRGTTTPEELLRLLELDW